MRDNQAQPWRKVAAKRNGPRLSKNRGSAIASESCCSYLAAGARGRRRRFAGRSAAGAAAARRRTGGGQRRQIDLDPRQGAIEPLKRERRHIDIGRRDDHRTAVQHHVGAAFLHDRLQDRIERNFNLARGLVEARLDLSLTLLDLALERLLLGVKSFSFWARTSAAMIAICC